VLKKIGEVPTGGPEHSTPNERVVIEHIKVTTRSEALKK
jgi:hypothetical protein